MRSSCVIKGCVYFYHLESVKSSQEIKITPTVTINANPINVSISAIVSSHPNLLTESINRYINGEDISNAPNIFLLMFICLIGNVSSQYCTSYERRCQPNTSAYIQSTFPHTVEHRSLCCRKFHLTEFCSASSCLLVSTLRLDLHTYRFQVEHCHSLSA